MASMPESIFTASDKERVTCGTTEEMMAPSKASGAIWANSSSRLMVTAYSAPVVSRLVAMRQRYRMSRPSMQPMTMWVFPMSSARIMTLPPYFPFCTAVLRAASLPRLNTTALAITAPVKKHTMASTRPLMPTKAMMNRNGLALPSASTEP